MPDDGALAIAKLDLLSVDLVLRCRARPVEVTAFWTMMVMVSILRTTYMNFSVKESHKVYADTFDIDRP